MEIKNPYLMFIGDVPDQLAAKTADGVAHWRPDWCVGQVRLEGCKADLDLPDMSITEAAAAGVKTLIVGVTNQGGYFADSWVDTIHSAIDHGMDIASGMHAKLDAVPGLTEKAVAAGCQLFDVRHTNQSFDIGRGHKRAGKRLLTVGTDTSCGKMFTALTLEKEMRARGMKADFRATGQTGIFIAGSGVAIDAVVSDFISGSVEWLCPENDSDHWDVVEGQGSIFHAGYAGVTLGLIHGSQPDVLVVCHDPGRPHMRGTPDIPVRSLTEVIEAAIAAARVTNPDVSCIGCAINTSRLSDADAEAELQRARDETGLPAIDPVKHGVGVLVDTL
jgi:uncharacterized NAD-dependent epimerase/dehydratase family protein